MARVRRMEPFDRWSMLWSVVVHLTIFTVAWLSTLYEPMQMTFETIQIELVSPPPAVQAEVPTRATEEIVVERPDPDPAPPEPEVEEIIPVEEPEPEPEPDQPPPDDPPEEAPTPEVSDDPVVGASEDPVEETPEESGEDLNVRIEGLKRDYPEYYENIINQIVRCFRWRDGGNWQAAVFFWIEQDGSIEEMEIYERSGSTVFDLAAFEAVECAGTNGRLRSLPDDLPYERFPVLFRFTPRGDAVMLTMQSGTTEGTLRR